MKAKLINVWLWALRGIVVIIVVIFPHLIFPTLLFAAICLLSEKYITREIYQNKPILYINIGCVCLLYLLPAVICALSKTPQHYERLFLVMLIPYYFVVNILRKRIER